ncbi:baseplate J/gp47 family protein [Glaesserella parasuis]|uniref:baseplate assembly protein n=1 Tax=Glaesserella parasuis TaxID=738 RepID=UPI0013124198|nr:baseplate J/gp47 family protein [Glaesserella parasuis]MDG6324352.1 baseplate J/gp47 family protein [Glaesserella parasuis]MDO9924427.1 baseplate J/gp47 family protein [Glaesserella parasuis]MDP0054358.1 baseplate J/gp47 family protein [Glaesserella parasuis]MDP0071073.1 baseplate J/gp47 family protein [Glaesserella parasuis]MDP0096373.1 baseplate J/gp47 family protein [Glaesserella parasuis]
MEINSRYDITVVPEDVKQILAETIAKYEQDTGKVLQPAHIERLIINVYAFREMLVRKGINEAFRQTFPQTATGIALDLCGETLGCHRLKDKSARCVLRFSVQGEHSSILIPKGTQVAITDDLYFITLNDDVITPLISYVEIEAECNKKGLIGNEWEIGRIKNLRTSLNTTTTLEVTNIDRPSGGLVEENDDDYRKRILAAPEAFSSCGSIAAYDYHVRAVSQDIADVNIATPKGGLVRITVLTKTGLPDTRLLNDIKKYVSAEKLRPLCDTVEVIAPTKRDYQIQAELILLDGYREDIVKTKARDAMQLYLADKTKKLGMDIVPSAIISVLRVDGVYDVNLISPTKTVIAENEWANCTALRIEVKEERSNG